MATIIELYKHRAATGYTSKHGVSSAPLPGLLVGLELEIENFSPIVEHVFGGFTFTNDGSLRTNPDTGEIGIEAISKPVAVSHVPDLLNAFFKKFGMSDRNYSERCSTHVHVNVQPLTFDQLTTICLLYQTVERLLFRYIGQQRDESIFCVPWYQSNISYSVVNKIAAGGSTADSAFRRWQKYSALNLVPVSNQGTIEFRHLYGTCDVKKITEWVHLISKMYQYALNTPLEAAKEAIVNMNTVSNYHEWLHSVFGEYAHALHTENFEQDLSVGVIDSKLMLTTEQKSIYHDFLRATVRAPRIDPPPPEDFFEEEAELEIGPREAPRAAAREPGINELLTRIRQDNVRIARERDAAAVVAAAPLLPEWGAAATTGTWNPPPRTTAPARPVPRNPLRPRGTL